MYPISFLTRKWRRSAKGNQFLTLQAITVVVFPGWAGTWYYQVAGEYSLQGYPSERDVKLAAFDAFQAAVARRTPLLPATTR